jgi:MOSC domain-containing protein YiiM
VTVTHEPEIAPPAAAVDRDRPMGIGRVEVIHVTGAASEPMHAVEQVRAVAGIGLEGDRYALGTGHYSADSKVDRQITLIAAEELDRLAAVEGIQLSPAESRRNVLTRGIDINALVGRRFRIGGVECEGTRLCEPCQYLTDLVGKPVLKHLVHRAGLRARILTDGEIAVGDEVVALD